MSKKKQKQKKAKNPDHLSFGKLLCYKSSDISAAWINVIMLNYLSMYASDALGVNVAVVGTLLLASKVVDAFTDILAGWLVDNTHTKLGKARPYELCIIGMTICTILLFCCSPEWAMTVKCAWIFCMYTLTFSIFSTLRGAANNPYTIRIFSNNQTVIKKVASYGGIITMFGSIVVSGVFPVLMERLATNASGWTRIVMIIMIPATLIGVIRFFTCKEDPSVDAASERQKINLKEIFTLFRRNGYVWILAVIMLCYNIVTNLAINSYYFKYIVGSTSMLGILSMASVVLLPLMLFFPFIMRKVGSMGKMITYFSGIGVVGYLIAFFSGSHIAGVILGYMMGTFATLPVAYYGVLFIMNVSAYNEILGMPRMEASSSILSNFMGKFGAAFGAYITGFLLSLGGYISSTGDELVTQPASALMMIRIDFAIVPAILIVVIGVCTLAFSRLEPKVEAFDAQRKAQQEAKEEAE